MILSLLPNPALDKTIIIPGFQVGRTYRPAEVLYLAGGKGFNFARALKILGQAALVVAPVGGVLGQYLLELAGQEGLANDCELVKGNTRTCLTLLDPPASYNLTELYEVGTALEPDEWEQLLERTAAHFSAAQFLVINGSFPPGVSLDRLYNLIERAKASGLAVVLDTYGPQLENILELAPALVKINQFEAEEAVGQSVTTPAQAWQAARKLQERGAQQVVITLGKEGAIGLTVDGEIFGWATPKVKAVCPVGSGDSLLAGIVAGLAQNWKLSEAAKWGVAAGTANTLQIGAGCFERQQVELLFPAILPLKPS